MKASGFNNSFSGFGIHNYVQTHPIPLLDNRLLQTGRWSLKKMEELSDFSQQMVATNSVDILLDSITRRAVALVQATFCRILTLDSTDSFVCVAAYHTNPLACRWVKGKIEPYFLNPIYNQILKEKKPVMINSSQVDLNEKERAGLELQYASCICFIPLEVEGASIGLMILGEESGFANIVFSEDQLLVASMIANQAAGALVRAQLSHHLEENRLETVLALAKTIEAKDHYTSNHSLQVVELAEKVARRMNCSEEEVQNLRWAALLHDIGKISIPDQILLKPGPLDSDDWNMIKKHPQIGADIVLQVSNLAVVASYVLSHHEHYDGSGYPHGLKGNAIPLGGRILAVIDAYSAITSGRVYRPARTHAEAVEELRQCSGFHFDPKVVESFLSLFNA